MALTKSVSKSSVRLVWPKMWSISITLRITDDGPGDGFTRTFSKNYKKAPFTLCPVSEKYRYAG